MQRVVPFFLLICVLMLAGCGESSPPDESAQSSPSPETGLADDAYVRYGEAPEDACQASVIEVFAYTCVHCYRFEPYLEEWAETIEQRDIEFRRMAMPGNQAMNTWARVFKALEIMDGVDQVHAPLFERLHGEGARIESLEELQAFIESHGLDVGTFVELLGSDEVTEALRADVEIMREARTTATPSLLVNNRYRLEPRGQRPFEDMLSAVDHLIERDRREAGC